jgi:tetratricopeptide (TPR) repeat protein
MIKKTIVLLSVCALGATLGCASGGGADVETIGGGDRIVRDERGFDKQLGPAEIAYQSAQQFLAGGNYIDAISQLRTAVSIKPNYFEAWSDLGNTLAKTKDFESSTAAYEKALALRPDNDPIIQAIAYNYLNLEDYNKAEQYYAKLLEKDPASYDGNVHLGFIYQKKANTDRAIEYYEKALLAQPNDATTLGTLAGLYDKLGNEDRKIEYLRRASEAAPDVHRYKTQLGAAYMKRRDFANALPVFEDLTRTFPDQAAYWQNLGLVLSQIPERKKEAPAALEKALELKGDDAYICGILAQVHNDLGDHQKAISLVKRGLDAKVGQEPLLYYQWGAALSKLGAYDESISMFERVVATRDPQWSDSASKQIERQITLKKREELKKQR